LRSYLCSPTCACPGGKARASPWPLLPAQRDRLLPDSERETEPAHRQPRASRLHPDGLAYEVAARRAHCLLDSCQTSCTGRDSRPLSTLPRRQRSSDGATASVIQGKLGGCPSRTPPVSPAPIDASLSTSFWVTQGHITAGQAVNRPQSRQHSAPLVTALCFPDHSCH
jgi:hypothetical protein